MTPRNPFDVPLVVPGFALPWVFAFLAIPLALLVLVWAGRLLLPHRRLVLPLDRAAGGDGWWLWLLVAAADSLPPLLLAVVILMLAGPLRNGPPKQKRSLTNIQLLVDVSGSMTAKFGDGTRYDASMTAIEKFVDFRKGDAFGLTFFGHDFLHWCPLTSDPSAVKCSLPFMRPENAPPQLGGTLIANCVRGCVKELQKRDDGDKMILLVTDGESDDITGGAETVLANELVKAGVTVFCVIVAEGDPQPEMYTICRTSGGEAFRADDPDALKAVFQKIDTLKPAKLTATAPEAIDYYEPFALAGLALLLVHLGCLFGLRYTPW